MAMLDEDNRSTMLAALKLIKDTMMERMMARPDKPGGNTVPADDAEVAEVEETEDPESPAEEAIEMEPGGEENPTDHGKTTIMESFVPRGREEQVPGESELKIDLMPKKKK